MNAQRQAKEAVVSDLNQRFSEATAAILIEYKGSTCDELTKLRSDLRPSGARFAIVKNTLAKRAVEGTPAESLAKDFVGPIAVLWTGEDPVAPAKVVSKFAKDNDTFILKSGVVDGDVVDTSGIENLASLPSREEILAKLLAVINAPATQLVRTINAPASQLVGTLGAWQRKLEEGGEE
jgi:large subunit ribosomal protein L10